MDDEDIRAGLRAGHSSAFEQLRHRYHRTIFKVCMRVLGNMADAEDAMQDALIRAYEKRTQLAAAGQIKSYLVTLAHNLAVDRIRKRQRRADLDVRHASDALATTAPGPAWEVESAERTALAECIDGLDEVTRTALLAHGEGDQSWEQIGAQANLTADAARMRVGRGLKALKACLSGKGFPP